MSTYKILVPIDFSDTAQAALELAVDLAKAKPAATVMLLHVDPGIVPFYDEELGVLEPSRFFHHMRIMAAERAAKADFPIADHIAYGDPVNEILRFAKDNEVNLIAMGTHGRTGLRRALLGSVAEGVLRAAPCPVLCVNEAVTGNAARQRKRADSAVAKN